MSEKEKETETETETPAKDPAIDELVDDALNSARGYRKVGELFVSVLAALPTATLLTSFVKLPEGSEWNERYLGLGLLCVTVSLLSGIGVAGWFRAPIALEDDDPAVKDFKMVRILGGERWANYGNLIEDIDALLTPLPAHATEEEKAATSANLKAHLRVRRDIYRLATADALRGKVTNPAAILAVLLAIAAAATAVGLFAVAAGEAEETTTTVPVSVTLTESGQRSFGCADREFTGLKIAGTDTEPQVVPLSTTCSSGSLLKLKVEGSASASKVEKVEGAEPSGDDTG